MNATQAVDVLTIDPAGAVIVEGAVPTAPPATQVRIGGGDLQIGRTSQASGSQVVRGDDLRLTPAFFSMIRDPSFVSVDQATTAQANRMHKVSGLTSDYIITLPSPVAGTVVGFSVEGFDKAKFQYKLDAGPGVNICGRARYLTLLHTNAALLLCDGQNWLPLSLSLDTPWVDEGGYFVGPGGITVHAGTNPTLGTNIIVNKRLWRRNGRDLIFRWNYRHAVGGSAGSGTYVFALPRGFQLDLPYIGEIDTNVSRGAFGTAMVYFEPNSNTGIGFVSAYSSNQVWLRVSQSNGSSAALISSTYFSFANTPNLNMGFTIQAPIVDW